MYSIAVCTNTHLILPVLLDTVLAPEALSSICLGLVLGELGLVLPTDSTL